MLESSLDNKKKFFAIISLMYRYLLITIIIYFHLISTWVVIDFLAFY